MSATKKWMRAHADNESFVVAVPVLGARILFLLLLLKKKNHFVVISIVNRIASQLIVIAGARSPISGNLSLNTIDTWLTGHIGWNSAIRDNFCRFQFNTGKRNKRMYSVAAVGRCLLFLLLLHAATEYDCELRASSTLTMSMSHIIIAISMPNMVASALAYDQLDTGKIVHSADRQRRVTERRGRMATVSRTYFSIITENSKLLHSHGIHDRIYLYTVKHRCGNYTPHIVASASHISQLPKTRNNVES